jgi:hypothetical protein
VKINRNNQLLSCSSGVRSTVAHFLILLILFFFITRFTSLWLTIFLLSLTSPPMSASGLLILFRPFCLLFFSVTLYQFNIQSWPLSSCLIKPVISLAMWLTEIQCESDFTLNKLYFLVLFSLSLLLSSYVYSNKVFIQ